MKVALILLGLLALSLNAKIAQNKLKPLQASHKADWGKLQQCVKNLYSPTKDLTVYTGDHNVQVNAEEISAGLKDFCDRPGGYHYLETPWKMNDNALALGKYCMIKAQNNCEIAFASGTSTLQLLRINKTGRDTGDLEYSDVYFNNSLYVEDKKDFMYRIDGGEWTIFTPTFTKRSFFRLKMCIELE